MVSNKICTKERSISESPQLRACNFHTVKAFPQTELIGTFRSDYEHEYEYEFFNVYPARMPDCVRLSRQLVLSSKSRRRLDTNYEIFNKSRPPTTSLLQVQRRVKRLVFKRVDTL